ncbi:putative ribosomal protein L10-like domain superfamily [Helianthus anomalus]
MNMSRLVCFMGNVGLIFTKGELKEVCEEVAKYKVGARARVGLVAPVDVVVPPGNIGLDPSQTYFFQWVHPAALLAKLGIRPFSYGLVVLTVYDNGSVFSPEVLDLTEDYLIEKFALGVSMVTSLALAIHYPTIAAAPHMLINGYKDPLAIAVETEYSFPLADKVKEYLAVSLKTFTLLYYNLYGLWGKM